MFKKITDWIKLIIANYRFKHSDIADENIDYLIKNGSKVYINNNGYWLTIETKNNEVYFLRIDHYPYAWLCTLRKMMYRKIEESEGYGYNTIPVVDSLTKIVYDDIIPSRTKMFQFKYWIENNFYKKWDYVDINLYDSNFDSNF